MVWELNQLFSCPVVSDSLWPHGLQSARPAYPSPSTGVCPSSCSLHQWCPPAISSSDTLFSFCSQSFPGSGTFPVSHLFASDDQKTSTSASASVLLVNIQDWSPLRLTGLISLLSKGLWGVPSTAVWTHKVFGFLSSLLVHLLQSYVTTGKTIALTMWTFVGRVMSLLFKTLSGFAISFLPRSNHLLISWLQSLCAMILEPNKRKSVTTSTFPPSICHVVMRPDAMIFVFFNIEF